MSFSCNNRCSSGSCGRIFNNNNHSHAKRKSQQQWGHAIAFDEDEFQQFELGSDNFNQQQQKFPSKNSIWLQQENEKPRVDKDDVGVYPNDETFYKFAKKELNEGNSHNHPFIDKGTYSNLYRCLREPNEVGGIFAISRKDGKLHVELEKLSGGQSNSVDVPLSEFEFHTHPGKCLSKERCALGTPSTRDMQNILERSAKGNIAHAIVAWEGVYVVKVKVGKSFHQNGYGANDIEKLKQVQQDFTYSQMQYPHFLQEWMKTVCHKDSCFEVDFFPIGTGFYMKSANKE